MNGWCGWISQAGGLTRQGKLRGGGALSAGQATALAVTPLQNVTDRVDQRTAV